VPTPNLGGVAVFAGFIISTSIFGGAYFNHEFAYMISGLIIIFMAGVKDDILILDPKKKLMAEIVSIIIIVLIGNIRINNFYGLFGITELPYFISIGFTIFVFIVIINGFNLIDGIDGLAASTGILASSVFGIWFLFSDNKPYAIMSFAFTGALCSFFRFNITYNKNKIFLGDTGSLIIGYVMSILVTKFLSLDISKGQMIISSAPAVAFGILIIPLYDTLRVFILRIKQGKSPFTADRQHLHHYLIRYNISHLKATIIIFSFNLMIITVCFMLKNIGVIWLSLIIIIISVCCSTFMVLFYRYKIKKELNAKYHTFSKLKEMYKDPWKFVKSDEIDSQKQAYYHSHII